MEWIWYIKMGEFIFIMLYIVMFVKAKAIYDVKAILAS